MTSNLKNVPPNWQKVRFDEIATIVTDRIEKPIESGLKDYIGLEHLDTDCIRIKRFGSTEDVDATKFLCKKGDIIFGKRRAYLRKVAVSDRDAVVSAHSMVLRPTGDRIYPDFLPCFMQSSIFWKTAHSISEGSMSPTIKWKNLAAQEFWLPSIKEQKKISDLLWSIEDNIQKTEKLIETTEKLKQELLNELLTKGIGHTRFKDTELGRIPEEWEIVITEQLLLMQKGSIKIGPFGSQLKKSYLVDKGYKVYGQENVYIDDFSVGDRFIDDDRFQQLRSCEITPGDILITMMGTIGKCAIVPNNIEKGIMDSHLLRLKIDESICYKQFLLHLLKSDLIQEQMINLSVGGIMAGLSSKMIKKLILPKPPILEQKMIAETLDCVDNCLHKYKKHIESLSYVKKKITNEFASGNLRVIDIQVCNIADIHPNIYNRESPKKYTSTKDYLAGNL